MNHKLLSSLLGLALTAVTAQAAAPSLSYKINGNEFIINYTGTLYQSADAVSWTAVASASSPYKVQIGNNQQFFCAKASDEPIDPLVPGKNGRISLPGGVSLDMNWINPGTFMMGSPEDELGAGGDETQHQVTLTKGYWLGKYEVTQAQYEAVIGENPSRFKGADLPVENVSWFDAKEFCARLTEIEKAAGRLPEGYEYTLPTEAQWEYACRAGTTTAFNNGTNIETDDQIYGECPNLDPLGWYWCNSESKTHPVGQKQPNAWGLYDMHGNVWEWCLDRYGAYPATPVVDPVGEDTEPYPAVRGGSYSYYDDGAKKCRSAERDPRLNTVTSMSLGFRVALVPTKNMTIPLAEGVNLDMIWINPGTFMMGSPKDELRRWADETQHEVTLTQGYWMGRYEVTQSQYEAIMGENPSRFKGADLPVERVNWFDAKEFCAKLTKIERASGRLPEGYEYTLPTEAQWEYACRAGTTTALNSGKNLSDEHECPEMDEVGWYWCNGGEENYDNGLTCTHPVGQKQPNVWGLYDMHGNVWEWCLDWGGDYPTSAVTDPTGPDTGKYRVQRGGSWDVYARSCRSARRVIINPDDGSYTCGFRVALAPVSSKDMTIPLTDKVYLDMIWIKPGTFLMGSPEDELGRFDNETQHEVTLTQGYWLGKYEITQVQYETIMGTNPSEFKGADLPVETVSWYDAKAFCAKLTATEKAAGRLPEGYEYTLPTEAQWEYACRAGTTTAFNNGTNIETDYQIYGVCPNLDPLGWYYINSDETTHPVGQKRPNLWGLYDMHGNVREWCLDWDGDYPTSAVTDPTGPDTGSYRVLRGGSWCDFASSCRSAMRDSFFLNGDLYNFGFRVALAPVPENKDMTIPLSEDVSLDMIWIEPGTFIMGSPENELGRVLTYETQHQVTLTKGYWLGKYEVTQAQYEAVMGKNPSNWKGADLPVEKVTWYDAKEFCAKLTASEKAAGRLPEGYEYTLPTEAQWEYACRAGTTTALNSGKNLSDKEQCPEMDEVGWYKYNSNVTTHPVGQKQPNAWGLYDMHGNAWEWCLDWYKYAYPASAVTDPTGPITGEVRVLRGGSENSDANACRSAHRSAYYPSYNYVNNIGFRVALAPVK